jgi:hypothetical protein
MERRVFSGHQEVNMSNINLEASLFEFTQLQDKIKKEQEMALSLASGHTSHFPAFTGPTVSPAPAMTTTFWTSTISP